MAANLSYRLARQQSFDERGVGRSAVAATSSWKAKGRGLLGSGPSGGCSAIWAFFLWAQYLTPGWDVEVGIFPFTDEKAQKWLENNANELVEQYFGEMPEGGAAERRLTLRIPNNLAKRLEMIAHSKKMPLNRYMNRCLERCAAEDGEHVAIV